MSTATDSSAEGNTEKLINGDTAECPITTRLKALFVAHPRRAYEWSANAIDPGIGSLVRRVPVDADCRPGEVPVGPERLATAVIFCRPSLSEDVSAKLKAWAVRPASPRSMTGLAGIDAMDLVEPLDRVHYLQACDRASALLASLTSAAIVAVAGTSRWSIPGPSGPSRAQ